MGLLCFLEGETLAKGLLDPGLGLFLGHVPAVHDGLLYDAPAALDTVDASSAYPRRATVAFVHGEIVSDLVNGEMPSKVFKREEVELCRH